MSIRRHWFRRSVAMLGIAASAATGANSASTEAYAARPALWEVSDSDTRIYLFGTIHMLPPNYQWRSPKLDKALQDSQTLVVETIIDPKNPAPLQAELARLGFRQGLPPLLDRVPPEKRAALSAAIARYKIPPSTFDQMETWVAAMTLLSAQFQSLGLKGQEGVEENLKADFTNAHKPIGELETNGEQLGYFDRLPEDAQRKLLVSALDSPQSMQGEFQSMLAAWVRGDTNAIAQTFNSDLADSPALMDALLKQRNANWANWIERRMAQPGSVMIAVGAGHLAGANSVQNILEQHGYKVKRLQ